MKEWFEVEKLYENTYAISEYHHCEETHAYLLFGRERALLVDSGLGIGNMYSEVRKLTDLPITVALTHAHWSNMGGLSSFESIAVHRRDARWVEKNFPLSDLAVRISLQNVKTELPYEFDLDSYKVYKGPVSIRMKNHQKFDLGGRIIEVIHTPGHSPGHVCFYERDCQVLFTGDLIYKGEIELYYQSTNPAKYKKSMAKVTRLQVKKIYPGRRKLHIPVEMIGQIYRALGKIQSEGDFRRGAGTYKFTNFKIHL